MFCKHCGNQVSDNALFCDKCGAKINDNGTSTSDPENKIFSKKIYIGSIVSFIVGAIGIGAIFFPTLFNLEKTSIKEFNSDLDTIDQALNFREFLDNNQGRTVKLNLRYSPKAVGAKNTIVDLDNYDTINNYDVSKMKGDASNRRDCYSPLCNQTFGCFDIRYNRNSSIYCYGGDGFKHGLVDFILMKEYANEYDFLSKKFEEMLNKNKFLAEIQSNDINSENPGIDILNLKQQQNSGVERMEDLIIAQTEDTVLIKFPFLSKYHDAIGMHHRAYGSINGGTFQYFGPELNFFADGLLKFNFNLYGSTQTAYIEYGLLSFLINENKESVKNCLFKHDGGTMIFPTNNEQKCDWDTAQEELDNILKESFTVLITSKSNNNKLYNWSWESWSDDDSNINLSGYFYVNKRNANITPEGLNTNIINHFLVDGYCYHNGAMVTRMPPCSEFANVTFYELDPVDERTIELNKH
jgi:hypothetical protein